MWSFEDDTFVPAISMVLALFKPMVSISSSVGVDKQNIYFFDFFHHNRTNAHHSSNSRSWNNCTVFNSSRSISIIKLPMLVALGMSTSNATVGTKLNFMTAPWSATITSSTSAAYPIFVLGHNAKAHASDPIFTMNLLSHDSMMMWLLSKCFTKTFRALFALQLAQNMSGLSFFYSSFVFS